MTTLSVPTSTGTRALTEPSSAACKASRIDDIIIEIHDTGVELVTIHDRPEGSALGSYYYVIEVENEAGITQEQIDKISGIEEVRLVGKFRSIEKTP